MQVKFSDNMEWWCSRPLPREDLETIPFIGEVAGETPMACVLPEVRRRDIGAEEIIERCMYQLVNEGAKLLEEGIAQRASDIDVIYANGYGFPAYRGGPMFYADTVGLDKVYAAVCRYRDSHGAAWEPAPLLKQLAESGGRFNAR